jgi:hypothetical protein
MAAGNRSDSLRQLFSKPPEGLCGNFLRNFFAEKQEARSVTVTNTLSTPAGALQVSCYFFLTENIKIFDDYRHIARSNQLSHCT